MLRKMKFLFVIFAAIVAAAMVPALAFADEDASLQECATSAVAMHRLYNPNSGEHFYTASDQERDELVAVGWNSEGEGWYAPEKSNTPVYRMYNPVAGEHHYTMDASERDGLVQAGWNYESIGWYSDDFETVALYRDYNPNQFANNHNYTVNESEHSWLVSLGWKSEGLAWYGVDPDRDLHHAVVKVQGYDEFFITLDADCAPITVANFMQLAQSGYYNGLGFYRIQEGFCLQGGSKGNSSSSHDPSLTPIKGEFSQNGVNNPLADNFQKGVVAMARTNDPNSATSAFFVTLSTSWSTAYSLNGKYAAFGTINEKGMQVVDAICNDHLAYVVDSMGTISDPAHMPIIESITIAD